MDPFSVERGTGFEPATTSLEGWCSATELPPHTDPARGPDGRVVSTLDNRIPRFPQAHSAGTSEGWWAGRDSNPRRREPTDLQSAPFGRLGTCPHHSFSVAWPVPGPWRSGPQGEALRPPRSGPPDRTGPAAGGTSLAPGRAAVGRARDGAGGRTCTDNRLFTKQVLYC